MQYFRSFHTAERTIKGIEGAHMMRKGQIKRIDGRNAVGQVKFVASLSGVAAKVKGPRDPSRLRAIPVTLPPHLPRAKADRYGTTSPASSCPRVSGENTSLGRELRRFQPPAPVFERLEVAQKPCRLRRRISAANKRLNRSRKKACHRSVGAGIYQMKAVVAGGRATLLNK